MRITFWGVRGSIASPGPDTAGVGGNTSCVEVQCGATRLILDAGTGVRRLGDKLLGEGPLDATVLLSHVHWDHIQGLPFFVPAYLPSTKLQIVGSGGGVSSLKEVLATQMTAPVFPVRLDELGAQLTMREVRSGETFWIGDARVRAAKLNHPGGVLAYRIDYDGHSVVYATDTEHYACVDPTLRALAEGADVLIYDSQYTPEEYRGDGGRSKVGWGHSTYVAGAELARAAGVGKYVLFHHDPQRNDAGVVEVERRARELFASSVAAREGMEIGLSPRVRAEAA
ncbi:Metal-dependent hydrolase of the beta-lactamase superfamily I [Minicystis rosea]|nr:Metal-dependent hydrolase of the beta-lactamase superfamily I [Minicystis rosea]